MLHSLRHPQSLQKHKGLLKLRKIALSRVHFNSKTTSILQPQSCKVSLKVTRCVVLNFKWSQSPSPFIFLSVSRALKIFTIPHQKPTCNFQRFAKQNKLKQALTILDYLDQQGIPVNPTSFTSLIAACVRTKSLTEGKQVYTHININGLENNEFLRTKLVNMCTTRGSVEDARQLFGECSSKNVYSWNTLLRGNVISGRWRYHGVLSTYTKMQELGVSLNVYSFSNVIKSFTGASALWQPLKIHALLINNGFVDTSILGMSLFDMYLNVERLSLRIVFLKRLVRGMLWCGER
ncbi:hypothetical protein CMV_010485 [Castanea mollissima]|uniref:Pentatricopeptide repeat-containing protein n=1 Tax=Castanea mollissima TaxID=60419 RepID=A0A8J4VPZ3_9ROSI|nr:hypothetical protein CMV_010485 [Castanea mollissima]